MAGYAHLCTFYSNNHNDRPFQKRLVYTFVWSDHCMPMCRTRNQDLKFSLEPIVALDSESVTRSQVDSSTVLCSPSSTMTIPAAGMPSLIWPGVQYMQFFMVRAHLMTLYRASFFDTGSPPPSQAPNGTTETSRMTRGLQRFWLRS
jgi:hypothetical protein